MSSSSDSSERDELTVAELRRALETERASTAHLRALAHRQAAALEDLRRRKVVRAVLAIERLFAPLRGRVARRPRPFLARLRLFVEALRTRRRRAARQAALSDAVAAREDAAPPPGRVSIVEPSSSPGVTAATGDLVCLLAATSEPLAPGWLASLAAALGDGVVAAAPALVHPARPLRWATPHDLATRELGLAIDVAEGVPLARAREAGEPVDAAREPVEVFAASAVALLVSREAFDTAGGLDPALDDLDDLDAAGIDLCRRLRATGGRIVAVPSAVVADHRPVACVRALTEPVLRDGPGWRAVVERQGPALVRSALDLLPGRLRFAVSVAAPSPRMASRWGDWHLAEALARSLRRLGHDVLLQTADRADDLAGRSCDVQLVLRGLRPLRRTPGQRHILWVISHPETVEVDECDEADLVLVASRRFAADLARRTRTPVEVLLQATDHERFRPRPPDPAHRHDVTVVAKTRDVARHMVLDALAAGLRPAIYGTGWEDFVDPSLVVADYVANEDLPVVYASAGVLLNDHWDTMRAWGFVSNRLFDALACGAPVVSDELDEVTELFGDTVPTYHDPAELGAIVAEMLADPAAARARAARGREIVLASHTFDHRARELVALLASYGLVDL